MKKNTFDQAFQSDAVKEKFDAYPSDILKKMLRLRHLIFEVAACTPGVGQLKETLKWGEPSYVTEQTKSGTTIRIDWKVNKPEQYGIYFNCKTTLVDTFKTIYGDVLTYGGNRSILLHREDKIPVDILSGCIAMALTYHLDKKRGCKGMGR